jgi:hypothetical protein
MTASKEILDFLTQPQNLTLALDITDYIDELKRNTHHVFWQALNNELNSRLMLSDLAGKWLFQQFPVKRLRKDWEKCHIKPAESVAASQLQFTIGQSVPESNFHLYCGVCWNRPPIDFFHPRLTGLSGMVIAEGLTVMEPPVWLGWNYISIIPFTQDFIYGMYNEQQDFVVKAGQTIWELFIKFQPEMETINQIIKGVGN